jgi:hypothetical protein
VNGFSLPEQLQLAGGFLGALLGGLVLVWRIRANLPHLLRHVAHVVTEAARELVREELEELVRGPVGRLEAVEKKAAALADSLERLKHVEDKANFLFGSVTSIKERTSQLEQWRRRGGQ